MRNIENLSSYYLSDYLEMAKILDYYGFDSSTTIRQFCEYELECQDSNKENFTIEILIDKITRSFDMDVSNAMMIFYYSYHCKFDNLIPLNKALRIDCFKYGYENNRSASAQIYKQKKNIINGETDLYCYFKEIFDSMENTHKGSVSPCDSDILIQSMLSYTDSPFYKRNGYTVKQLRKFINTFKNVFDDDKTKNHINSYLFERIYHIDLVYTIADFYNIYNTVIDKIRFEEASFVYDSEKNQYFDINNVTEGLKSYVIRNRSTPEQAKNTYKRKCKDFILNLCEFAIIPDVYTRKKELCQFISENIQNIIDEKLYIDTLHSTVSRFARQAIIYNEIFYYHCIYWSIARNNQCPSKNSQQNSGNAIWKSLFSYEQTKKFLKAELKGIEKKISESCFDLKIITLSERFPECDDILNDLLQKVLFENHIFYINEKILKYPFIGTDFDNKYQKLINEALDKPILINYKKLEYISASNDDNQYIVAYGIQND